MIIGPLHALADIGNVGENRTTVTFTQTLGRRDLIRLGTAGQQIGVVALNEGEESGHKQRVGDGLRGVVSPDTGSSFVVTLGDDLFLLLGDGTVLLCNTGLGELGLEITGVDLLRLLLLLLQSGGVELAVGGGGLVITALGVLGLLALLLFRKTLEEFGNFVDGLVCGLKCRGQYQI